MPPRPLTHPLALERLAAARRPDGQFDLLAAAVAIATHHTPTLKPAAIHTAFDRFARDARHMLAFGNPLPGVLRHVLFDRHGFAGNTEHYEDPLNSYIDRVLVRKTGLPILLSLVYVQTARLLGATAHGIGLPGHFIAALDTPEGRLYVDAFGRGAPLTAADCQARVSALGLPWQEGYLEPVTPVAWITRMLANLRNVYAGMGDPANTAAVLEQMMLVNPALDREELAALYTQLDRQASRNN